MHTLEALGRVCSSFQVARLGSSSFSARLIKHDLLNEEFKYQAEQVCVLLSITGRSLSQPYISLRTRCIRTCRDSTVAYGWKESGSKSLQGANQ